ncbi:DegV family protein [Adlercreutzia faecimuris]|uniref:DegV family protein n=1 Tax=Adlercreutzia faecimuris TaxID=2897341 RepID=A0ABS9WFU0_9ACTN|nr:DegV family protein [Adlercreutzia sp. JBNU-10]MCI2241440.1 DegV family protein [Adlercreutzia sp. JBNU-10]
MGRYIIVTETGGDIPAEFVERYGLEMVPMHVTFGDRSLDDGSFPVADIFAHYRATGDLPRTSGCTPQDFADAFARIDARSAGEHVLYLAYSACTTCSFESARMAAEGRGDVTAIDTKSVTAGLFLVVTNTARFLEDHPDAPLPEVEAFVASQVERVRMAFIPGGLDFLRAGGRLSNGAYLGAQLLRIKPVIEILDGKLVATKKLRGSMEKAVLALVDDFLSREPLDVARVALIRNEGLDEGLQRQVEDRVRAAGFQEVTWIETGGVISSHCGPGSFGIAAVAAE